MNDEERVASRVTERVDPDGPHAIAADHAAERFGLDGAHAIAADHVTKRFRPDGAPAVDDVSFTVESGELVVLLGPSGCGKTTLLKMVNRLYEPTSGRILVDGTDAAEIPATELRRRIGYVIQETGLFPHMTIEANIAVVPRLLGWDRPRISNRVGELMSLLGLPESYRARRPRQLSGGERQRVGIARAMAADPALMLMDEPFGALDAITRVRLQREFLTVQRQVHKTVLFVTHDVEEAMRLADRILVLRDGTVVQYDTPLQIVMAPADEFVVQLLNADDALRRLSMLTVDAFLAMERLAEPSYPDSEDDVPDGKRRETPGSRPRMANATVDANALPTGTADDDRSRSATAGPTASAGDDLRTVLTRLLASGADHVTVLGDEGRVVARLGFEDLRAAAGSPDFPQKGGSKTNQPSGTEKGGSKTNQPSGTEKGGSKTNQPSGTETGGTKPNKPSGTETA